MEGQRDKARAQAARSAAKKGDEFAHRRTERGARRRRRPVRGLHDARACRACRSSALFDEERQPVDALSRRASAATSRWRGRRSTSRPAARSRTPAASSTSDRRARPRSKAWSGSRPGLPRAHRVRVSRGRAAAARHRHRRSRRRRARRHAPQPHRDAPAARGAARRCSARTSSRRARSSRPIACASTSCTSSRSRATSSTRIERIVNEQIVPQHAGADRGALDRGSDRGGRDGALRREVRRQRARRQRPGLQHGAVRRHARQRHRRHRLLRRSSRRAASPRACAASKRSPASGAVAWAQQQRGDARDASSRRCTSTDDRRSRRSSGCRPTPSGWRARSTQLKMKAGAGRRRRRRGASDTVEVAGVKLGAPQGRRPRQGRAARARRLAQAQDQERRRRPRVGKRRQGAARRLGHAGPDGRIKAGQIVKELAPIVGGGGGGRPDFAEAGGKDPEKIDEMLTARPPKASLHRRSSRRYLAPAPGHSRTRPAERRGRGLPPILLHLFYGLGVNLLTLNDDPELAALPAHAPERTGEPLPSRSAAGPIAHRAGHQLCDCHTRASASLAVSRPALRLWCPRGADLLLARRERDAWCCPTAAARSAGTPSGPLERFPDDRERAGHAYVPHDRQCLRRRHRRARASGTACAPTWFAPSCRSNRLQSHARSPKGAHGADAADAGHGAGIRRDATRSTRPRTSAAAWCICGGCSIATTTTSSWRSRPTTPARAPSTSTARPCPPIAKRRTTSSRIKQIAGVRPRVRAAKIYKVVEIVDGRESCYTDQSPAGGLRSEPRRCLARCSSPAGAAPCPC